MKPETMASSMRSIYKLVLSEEAIEIMKKKSTRYSVYSESSLYEMVIIAENESVARMIAFHHKSSYCYSTEEFWRPVIKIKENEFLFDIEMQKKFITCIEINMDESSVLMTSEQHATG